MKTLTIGKIAVLSGVGVETVRFYEKERLIDSPPRRPSGYRDYPIDTVDRILFIKNAKDLGFTLMEIKELLNLKLNDKGTCGGIKQKAELKLIQIEEKLKVLKKMKSSLKKLVDACQDTNKATSECPILDNFEKHERD